MTGEPLRDGVAEDAGVAVGHGADGHHAFDSVEPASRAGGGGTGVGQWRGALERLSRPVSEWWQLRPR
jgi:hypothetical protein